jgi:hypothetical protein
MLHHYSHVRVAAKPTALEKLESGLMGPSWEKRIEPLRHNPVVRVEASVCIPLK